MKDVMSHVRAAFFFLLYLWLGFLLTTGAGVDPWLP